MWRHVGSTLILFGIVFAVLGGIDTLRNGWYWHRIPEDGIVLYRHDEPVLHFMCPVGACPYQGQEKADSLEDSGCPFRCRVGTGCPH